jgi:phosphate transport system substrate-binding protein
MSAANVVTIQGSGATFPAPLYKRWFREYYTQHPNVRTNYLAIGSGAGVNQLAEGLSNFGASDEPLSKKKLDDVAASLSAAAGTAVELVQIPMTAGSVAVAYNLEGDPPLKLSRKAYVGIFLGEIDYWDHPDIARSNPGVDLPHQKITCVWRAEGSGTTFVFSNHLNTIDARWRRENGGPGVGKTVLWPVGFGGKGTAGVAAYVRNTPGAVGYIETGYAELTEPPIPVAALENKAGKFVMPKGDACKEALAEARFNEVLGATVSDPVGKNAYPIVTFTWIICRRRYSDPRLVESIRDLLRYCLTEGQKLSTDLGYVPLPPGAAELSLKQVERIGSP